MQLLPVLQLLVLRLVLLPVLQLLVLPLVVSLPELQLLVLPLVVLQLIALQLEAHAAYCTMREGCPILAAASGPNTAGSTCEPVWRVRVCKVQGPDTRINATLTHRDGKGCAALMWFKTAKGVAYGRGAY
eukprot:1160097-Pelagomonas_calceolata.AAC.8